VQPPELTPAASASASGPQTGRRAVLMEKAKALEAAFLMLSYAGAEAAAGSFSGGVGEEQYASFLRDAQAKSIVEHGGIGLAEKLFQSLVKNDHAPK
jgi:peptidoglycan hydrolase FlgJ